MADDSEKSTKLTALDISIVHALFKRMGEPLSADERAKCEVLGVTPDVFMAKRNRELMITLPGFPADAEFIDDV